MSRHNETLQKSLIGTKPFDLAHRAACRIGTLGRAVSTCNQPETDFNLFFFSNGLSSNVHNEENIAIPDLIHSQCIVSCADPFSIAHIDRGEYPGLCTP